MPLAIRIPGADLAGVKDATSFLNRAKPALKAGKPLAELGEAAHVLVVGGGNTAMVQ